MPETDTYLLRLDGLERRIASLEEKQATDSQRIRNLERESMTHSSRINLTNTLAGLIIFNQIAANLSLHGALATQALLLALAGAAAVGLQRAYAVYRAGRKGRL